MDIIDKKEKTPLQAYRERRATAGIQVRTTSREAVFGQIGLEQGAAAQVPADVVEAFETLVDETVAECQFVAQKEFGFEGVISVRHDWTWRTAQAMAPRSRGGRYSGWFRELDVEEDEAPVELSERGAGVSLRLAKYARSQQTSWHEYKSFNTSQLIGGRQNISLSNVLRFLAAHEAAHAVEYSLPKEIRFDLADKWEASGRYIRAAARGGKIGGHEGSWQAVYYMLREALGLNELGIVYPPKMLECRECGASLEVKPGFGRPQLFCTSECRISHHRKKKKG